MMVPEFPGNVVGQHSPLLPGGGRGGGKRKLEKNEVKRTNEKSERVRTNESTWEESGEGEGQTNGQSGFRCIIVTVTGRTRTKTPRRHQNRMEDGTINSCKIIH